VGRPRQKDRAEPSPLRLTLGPVLPDLAARAQWGKWYATSFGLGQSTTFGRCLE
jgi:hypothetical protein